MTGDELKRQLGFWDSVAINIGIVIGVGIFRVPAEVAHYLDQSQWILIAWILGGLISLLGVFCYAELSSCYPQTGGTYVYLREAYGKLTGFLFGWIEFSILRAGSFAGVAYVFATYMKNFVDFGPATEKVVAISALVFFTAVNIGGLRYGTRVQNVLSTLKVLILLGMTAAIFTMGETASILRPAAESSDSEKLWLGFAPALIPILWTYGGWNESTFMSGEFKDTRRALPRSLIVSILIITALYVSINAAYLKVMPPPEMVASQSIASDIFQKIFGSAGAVLISLAVLTSASGALNSYVMTGARIPFAMAQDAKKLSWLGIVHARYETPMRSYIVNCVWASVLILWGNFHDLLFFTGFAKWFFFTLAGASVFVLRRRLRHPEAYSMPGYPVVPVLFMLVSAALFSTTVIHAPRESFLGACILVAGIPIYYVLNYRKRP